ncbi:CBS domain-containing protein [Phycisphaerales bacterium AB-hyl4]|uniref:CBS domain-containing protein n=1 Tax=Natronomicrosphaera hydrolytica TaxID=3242702 RepID=A0ABV4U9Y6_9BACT
MQASEMMTTSIHCCTPTTRVADAAKKMKEHDIGAIPIVESESRRKLIGMLTDRDIVVRLVAESMNPLECDVEDAMTGQTFSVTPETSEEEVCQLMEEHQVRRVPVVDNEGNCLGIISQADIARRATEHETAELLKDISRPSRAA